MHLGDLLDVSMLVKLAEANYRANGMPVGIIDAVDGSVVVGVGWQDICTLFHRVNRLTLERCRESDEYIKAHLGEKEPCEYTCRNGLRDIAVPIRAAGRHFATLFLGQFFYEGESPAREFFIRQAKQFGFDEKVYLAAFDRVPAFSRMSVENILAYNKAFASFISSLAEEAILRKDAEEKAQSLARFPMEDPNPVLRVAGDLTICYANAAAQSALAMLGAAVGAPAPHPIRELAVRALTKERQVEEEVPVGEHVFAVCAVAVAGEVNIYAHEITSRRLMEQELREANRAKDEFLAMLSHEIRNPLTPIRNSLYILDHVDASGQQAHRAKEIAGRQLGYLTRLVDDLLDVTRIVRGKVELRRGKIDVALLAKRTGEDHTALMQERGLVFEIDVPNQPAWVDGDETRLAQVIGNLLENAAKFTPQGGTVRLSIAHGRSGVEVLVEDSGAGIEPGLLERVFDPFVQAKQTLARQEGGLGLGLALVKGIVDLHGGKVAARSAGLGRGAEFTIWLPILRSKRSAAVVPGETTNRGAARQVLIVDDNRDAAESLADVVRMLGHDARVAFDGQSAIQSVRDDPPDIVLCDIGLPGLSGYQVAQALRADERFDSVELIAVTGYARPEDRELALGAGFADHLPKPPDPDVLLRLLSRHPTRH